MPCPNGEPAMPGPRRSPPSPESRPMTDASPWWDENRHADRRGFLIVRDRIRRALRAWFEAEGFIEVEPGIAQVSPGNETHLHAFATEAVGTDLARVPLYLNTSPEFAMKKLLAAGEEKIFAFQPVFRNRERGRLHAPEFTMLEWYRAGTRYDAMMADCEAILRHALAAAGTGSFRYLDRTAALPEGPLHAVSVAEALAPHLGLSLCQMHAILETEDWPGLAAAMRDSARPVARDDTWSSVLSRLLSETDAALGHGIPAFLTDYPSSEAALARTDPARPWIAERFELFACGVELANGFTELTDPGEQRRRFEADEAERERIYGERYAIDEDFLDALASMPPASGCALGFDRLVMLATGAPHIDLVRWTPWPGDRQ